MEINGSHWDASSDVDQSKVAAATKTRRINTAVDLVKGAISSLADEDRKCVLELALRELSSTLSVHRGGRFFHSLFLR